MIIIAMESKNGDSTADELSKIMDAIDKIADWRVFVSDAPLCRVESIFMKKILIKKKGIFGRIFQWMK